jgi:uncharacterized protein (DUF1778 family)
MRKTTVKTRSPAKAGALRKRPAGSAGNKSANLLVRFDRNGKSLVQRAAASRGLTVSEYVRTRILSLARQDVVEAETQVLRLSREDQIAFWQALQKPPAPTGAQRRLGQLVRSVL